MNRCQRLKRGGLILAAGPFGPYHSFFQEVFAMNLPNLHLQLE